MIIEVRPDNEVKYDKNKFKIFLAGTIDDGRSEKWQNKLLSDMTFYHLTKDSEEDLGTGCDFSLGSDREQDIVVFNPRRDDWDDSWEDEKIEEQIRWEQEKMDEADIIVMVLIDDSKSPISLLELGIYGPQGKLFVFCTDKFYRFLNVKLTCEKYWIDLYQTTDTKEVVKEIDRVLDELDEYENK